MLHLVLVQTMVEQHLKWQSGIDSFRIEQEHTARWVCKNHLGLINISPCIIIRHWSIGYVSPCGHQLKSKNNQTKLTNGCLNPPSIIFCMYNIFQNRWVLRSRGKGDSTSLWRKWYHVVRWWHGRSALVSKLPNLNRNFKLVGPRKHNECLVCARRMNEVPLRFVDSS